MENIFPPGWDEERVREVIAYHERQTEEQVKAEIEEGLAHEGETLISIPHGLLSVVLELLEHYEQVQEGTSQEAMEPSAAPFAVTLPAVVKEGQIKLLTSAALAEGTNLLVTALSYDAGAIDAPHDSSVFDSIWDNDEDDVYADLLKA